MKRIACFFVVCYSFVASFAQVNGQDDSGNVTTVSDLLNEQQEASKRLFAEDHMEDVWKRRTYFDVSYVTSKLSPKGDIKSGVVDPVSGEDLLLPDFKSKWGLALKWGRSYRLHKPAIARILQFNLDYTWIDLNVNSFDAEGDGHNLYDSRNTIIVPGKGSAQNKEVFYTPWNLQKIEANYGMALGPSISVAPFTSLKAQQLHYLQFHMYYHLGYEASVVFMKKDGNADVDQSATEAHDKMANKTTIDWGHGLTNTFGFSLTWKFVGIGYEHKAATIKYKGTDSDFDKTKHKFKNTNDRICLQFRF